MTDEELCKALRSALWGQGHHINIKAADRIEALTAKVKLMDDLDVINGEKIEALTAEPHAEGEAWGILNPYGELWTHDTFQSEDAARRDVETFWRGTPTAGDLSGFKPVRVNVRVTLAEIEGEKT